MYCTVFYPKNSKNFSNTQYYRTDYVVLLFDDTVYLMYKILKNVIFKVWLR